MGTESIQNPSKTLHRNYESYGVFLNCINGEDTDALQQGQAVYISGNKSVKAKKLGSQKSIGVVQVGAIAGDKCSVRGNVLCSSLAKATGGALAAGALCRYNGDLDADGIPKVVAVLEDEWADGIVWSGGAEDAEITIFFLRAPIKYDANS